MVEINKLLSGGANCLYIMTDAQLEEVIERVIARTKDVSEQVERKETYLSPEEAADMISVSTNTLWRWNNIGYLKPIKVGRKSRYKLSDVKAILEGGKV